MRDVATKNRERSTIDLAGFAQLVEALIRDGRTVVAPLVRDGALDLDVISTATDLPAGWGEEKERGRYRLRRRDDGALFGYTVGPQSLKRYLLPSPVHLWTARRREGEIVFEPGSARPRRLAVLGARSCDLEAAAAQDAVLAAGQDADPFYRAQRADLFVVAVHCTEPGATCFCVSMGGGPRAAGGFDLALTELAEGGRHLFVVDVGSDDGARVLADVAHRPASAEEVARAEGLLAAAARGMGRELEVEGLREALYGSLESAQWEDAGRRCLACTNCTLVCPTCFCTTVRDVEDLSGEGAERWRTWDSCFTLDFSYIHGGSIRATARSRYRQWLTHKLASWEDQFGRPGCVGCGRCIVWCPAGIDITEEARALREGASRASGGQKGEP